MEVAAAWFESGYSISGQRPEQLLSSFMDRFDHCDAVRDLLAHPEMTEDHIGAALERLVQHFRDENVPIDHSFPHMPLPQPGEMRAQLRRLKSAEKKFGDWAGWDADAGALSPLIRKLESFIESSESHKQSRGAPLKKETLMISMLDDALAPISNTTDRIDLIARLVTDFVARVDPKTVYQRLVDKANRRSRAPRESSTITN